MEISVTPDQGEKLQWYLKAVVSSEHAPREMRRLGVTAICVQRLRAAVTVSAARAQAHLEGIRAVMTAAQFIRYESWTMKNAHRIAAAAADAAVATAAAALAGTSSGAAR